MRRPEKDTPLHEEQLLNFTREGNWIIAVDDCFPVAQKLFELLKKLKKRKYQHIHFLICARDTDWINSDADKQQWRSVSNFSRPRLKALMKKMQESL